MRLVRGATRIEFNWGIIKIRLWLFRKTKKKLFFVTRILMIRLARGILKVNLTGDILKLRSSFLEKLKRIFFVTKFFMIRLVRTVARNEFN